MSEIHFTLHLSADQYLAFYQGIVKDVQVVSWDGKTLRFPANILRPFVKQDGVHGDFALDYDDNNRFQGIRQIIKKPPNNSCLA